MSEDLNHLESFAISRPEPGLRGKRNHLAADGCTFPILSSPGPTHVSQKRPIEAVIGIFGKHVVVVSQQSRRPASSRATLAITILWGNAFSYASSTRFSLATDADVPTLGRCATLPIAARDTSPSMNLLADCRRNVSRAQAISLSSPEGRRGSLSHTSPPPVFVKGRLTSPFAFSQLGSPEARVG